MEKWWFIRNVDVKEIIETLKICIKEADENCAEGGCMCDLTKTHCSRWLSDTLHILETGIRPTKKVPKECLPVLR